MPNASYHVMMVHATHPYLVVFGALFIALVPPPCMVVFENGGIHV